MKKKDRVKASLEAFEESQSLYHQFSGCQLRSLLLNKIGHSQISYFASFIEARPTAHEEGLAILNLQQNWLFDPEVRIKNLKQQSVAHFRQN